MAQNNTRIELRISDDLLDEIDRHAAREHMSRAAWIREVCQKHIILAYSPAFKRHVDEEIKRISDWSKSDEI